MDYRWDFSFLLTHHHVLLLGLLQTLKLAAVALTGGLLIGLPVGIGRMSRARIPRWLASCYVEIFRNTPNLIQLFFIFYVVPVLTGIQSNAFLAASLSLSLYTGAHAAEIYRAGIESIERGQTEAAKALGFNFIGQMRYFILPQAIKRMVPAFTNRSIELIKATALASMIAYGELVYQAKLLATQEFRPLESLTAVAVMYSLILLPLSYFAIRLERRLRRSE